MTAAHCVDSGFPGSVRVASSSTSNGIVTSVQAGAIHPDWTGSFDSGVDAAVMKLGNWIDRPTIVMNNDPNRPGTIGEDLFVVGYGQTSNDEFPSNLQGAYLQYSGYCYSNNQYFCTDSSDQSTCGGDSGAPLVLRGTNIQVGLVSWGNSPTCSANTVSGFQDIVNVEPWVQSQICILSNNPPANCANTECSRAEAVTLFLMKQIQKGKSIWNTWRQGGQ